MKNNQLFGIHQHKNKLKKMGIIHYLVDKEKKELFNMGKGYYSDLQKDENKYYIEKYCPGYIVTLDDIKRSLDYSFKNKEYIEYVLNKIKKWKKSNTLYFISDIQDTDYNLQELYSYVESGDRYMKR